MTMLAAPANWHRRTVAGTPLFEFFISKLPVYPPGWDPHRPTTGGGNHGEL